VRPTPCASYAERKHGSSRIATEIPCGQARARFRAVGRRQTAAATASSLAQRCWARVRGWRVAPRARLLRLDDLIGHSITWRIAVGPRAGQKLFTLQTVPARPEEDLQSDHREAANAGGFSLHAGLDIGPQQRAKLERLCRYVSRLPMAEERLALTTSGQVRYQLKTRYRDGTTHIVMEPLDLMARLAALVPPPRMHLTRYHGVFAPHSTLRAAVTPAHRGMGSPGQGADQAADQPVTPHHAAMHWAPRLKRDFGIEIDRSRHSPDRLLRQNIQRASAGSCPVCQTRRIGGLRPLRRGDEDSRRGSRAGRQAPRRQLAQAWRPDSRVIRAAEKPVDFSWAGGLNFLFAGLPPTYSRLRRIW